MHTKSAESATLTLKGKSYELPVYSGTIGPDVIDIGKLYGQAGVFTFDPGYTSTGSCESEITYIDGEKGELLYRGYPIEQLAEKSHFSKSATSFSMVSFPTPHRSRISRAV